MLYGLRDAGGALIAVAEQQLSGEWQVLDRAATETRQFLRQQGAGATPELDALAASDLQFIRVLDDVIELLIEKQLLQFTELPKPAQDKLLKRRWHRQQLRGDDDTTHLIDPQDGLI